MCGGHGVFPVWSYLGQSWTGWVRVSISDGHLLLSWKTPLADCSRGLNCWSSRIVPGWLKPVLLLCWSFWGPATGLDARFCQTPSSSLQVVEQKNLKQSWLPAFWEKIQNTQDIKRTLFNSTKQDKTCKFSRKSSFSSYVQQKNKQTKKHLFIWHKVRWINCLVFWFFVVVCSLEKRTSSKICTFCPVLSN